MVVRLLSKLLVMIACCNASIIHLCHEAGAMFCKYTGEVGIVFSGVCNFIQDNFTDNIQPLSMQFIQHCWVTFEYITQIIWIMTMPINIEDKKKKKQLALSTAQWYSEERCIGKKRERKKSSDLFDVTSWFFSVLFELPSC